MRTLQESSYQAFPFCVKTLVIKLNPYSVVIIILFVLPANKLYSVSRYVSIKDI